MCNNKFVCCEQNKDVLWNREKKNILSSILPNRQHMFKIHAYMDACTQTCTCDCDKKEGNQHFAKQIAIKKNCLMEAHEKVFAI